MKRKINILFALFILLNPGQRIFSQNLDSTSIISIIKLTLFLDFNNQNLPTKEELNCLLNGEDNPFEIKYLQKKGFKDFVFIKVVVKTTSNNVINKNNCSYRINLTNQEYIIAFDITHKKGYKLKGFSSTDFQRLYNEYVYLYSNDFPSNRKKKRKYFIEKFSIEGLDIKALLKKSGK